MVRRWSHSVVQLFAIGILVMTGCGAATTELDLTTDDAAQDHQKIATYYSHEAARLRQATEDLAVRITVYERLFGPTSDWVTGTRLLIDSYEETASGLERRARDHRELGTRPRTKSEGPSPRH
jgi:hypothetical protein